MELTQLRLSASDTSATIHFPKNQLAANFWFALTLKKDSFNISQLDVAISACHDGVGITVNE